MLGIKPQQGVNLIELLAVLAVVVILSVMTIPTFISYLNNKRVIATAQNLYYGLQYARTEAIKRGSSVYVSVTTGSNWCYGINPGATCTCSSSGSCTLGSTTPPNNKQTTLSATGLSSNAIQFEGVRGAASNSSSFTFAIFGQSNSITIKVTALGNMSMCSSTISGYPACS